MSYRGDYDFIDSYGYDYYYREKSHSEKVKILKQLIDQIKEIDKAKDEILNNSISLKKLGLMSKLLRKNIRFERTDLDTKYDLMDKNGIEKRLHFDGLYNFRLDVRRGDMFFPKYYLCDAEESWYNVYGIITNDYYLSPDYDFADKRFARLMIYGHEMPFIRMSQFKEATMKMFKGDHDQVSDKAEKLLEEIGNHIMQYAWHEDQLIGWLISEKLNLPGFKEAMEVIYFNLGADFSDTRNHVSQDIYNFFTIVYEQDSLKALFKKIESLSGDEFRSLELISRHWYNELNAAFSVFLRHEVPWGILKGAKYPCTRLYFPTCTASIRCRISFIPIHP